MAKTTVEIIGKETLSEAAGKAASASRMLSEHTGGLIKSFTDLSFAGGEVKEVIAKIAEAVEEGVKEWAILERAQLSLSATMGDSAESMTKFAESIATMSGEDHAAVMAMEAFLATAGRTDEQIREIIQASVGLSAATGKDLDSAVKLLNGTFAGTTERLGRLLPGVGDLTKAQLENGEAVKIALSRYEGLNAALSQSTDVSVKNLKNAMGDLYAQFGRQNETVLRPMRDWVTSLVTQWTNATARANDYREALQKIGDKNSLVSKTAELTVAMQDKETTQLMLNMQMRDIYPDGVPTSEVVPRHGMSGGVMAELPSAYQMNLENQVGYKELQGLNAKIIKLTDEIAALTKGTISGLPPATPPGSPQGKPANYDSRWWTSVPQFGAGSFPPDRYHQAPPSDQGYQGAMIDTGVGNYRQTPHTDQGYQGAMIVPTLLEQIGGGLSTAIDAFMGPIAASFTPAAIAATLLGKAFDGMMQVLGPVVDTILTPIFNIFGMMGEIIGNALVPIFQFLAETILPIVMVGLKSLATAIEILMSPVKFLGDLFSWIGKVIQDFGHNIIKAPWDPAQNTAGDFSSDAFTGLGGRIASIWSNNYSSSNTPYASSTSRTGSSASYQQARDIIVNVQVNTAALVGDGGIRDFAVIIGRELRSAGVLGIA